MIVSMKRLTLIALRSDEQDLLQALQKIGSVEVLNISDAETQNDQLDAAASRIQRLSSSIEAVKPFAEKKSFLSPQKRTVSLSDIHADADRADEVTEHIESLLHEKSSLTAERSKKEALRADLLPWRSLNVPMSSVKNTKRVTYFVGFCAQKDQRA